MKYYNDKPNTCGIIGLCTGWLIPLAGIALGIIALARKEKTKAIGIISIAVSALFWIIYAIIAINALGA